MSEEYDVGDPNEIFEYMQKLGSGSYGVVCKCRNLNDNRIYAVKILDVEEEEEESLKQEIDILKKCQHDHIVHFGGCWKREDRLLIAMEYCQGGSALDLMEMCDYQFNEDELSAILYGVVKGLVYLHANNIMHRDIKGGNVLLHGSGLAKLADFGVSAQLETTSQARNTVIGSPYWMAPEIIVTSGKGGYNNKADIWSVGITAIELAEGKPPRHDISFSRVIFVIPNKDPPTLQEPDKYSPEFSHFIALCLEKDPSLRTDADALLDHPFIRKGSLKQGCLKELLGRMEDHINSVRDNDSDSDSDEDELQTIVGTILKGSLQGVSEDEDDFNYCTFKVNQSNPSDSDSDQSDSSVNFGTFVQKDLRGSLPDPTSSSSLSDDEDGYENTGTIRYNPQLLKDVSEFQTKTMDRKSN